MHLPRFTPRFTVRRLMVAVAIVGIVLGVTIERRDRFRRIAVHHRAEFQKLASRMKAGSHEESDWLPIEWHESLARKYKRAACYPWLPVATDPPEPE
jgi:hypothetical protein